MAVDEDLVRFHSYYRQGSPGECWLWEGPRNKAGQPQISWQHRTLPAARVAYLITHDVLPAGHRVLRGCAEPSCVNPGHLTARPPILPPAARQRRAGAGRKRKDHVRLTCYVPAPFIKDLRAEALARDIPMGELIVEAFAARVTFIRCGAQEEGRAT